AARIGSTLSPDRSKRRGGLRLQSNQRNRSAGFGGAATRKGRIGASIDEHRRLDPGGKLSRINQRQGCRHFTRTAKPNAIKRRSARSADRGIASAAKYRAAKCRSRPAI